MTHLRKMMLEDVSSLWFSPDSKRLITAHKNGHMKAWNTSSRTVERELIADPDQRLDGIRFSPDGKLLITTHANGHVKVWNTSSWTVEGELNVSDSHLRGSAFVPDSKTIIIGGKNGVLHDWSLATKAEIRTLRIFEGVGNISNVALSPDGKTMVASYESAKSRAVMIWNTTDSSAQIESGYISAAFSKDGKLALGGRGDIKLIDPDSRKDSRKQIRDIELPEMMPGEVEHGDKDAPDAKETVPCGVLALAFSPDGNTLAAGCLEGTVRLVKVAP